MYSFEDSLGFQVNKTANTMRSHFNRFLKPYGLTAEQYVILKAIHENAKISPSQLSEILAKNKSSTTRIIETLVKNGFIQRQQNKSDRRSHALVFTLKANTVMSEILPMTNEIIGNIRNRFKARDLDSFLTILAELRSIDYLENL